MTRLMTITTFVTDMIFNMIIIAIIFLSFIYDAESILLEIVEFLMRQKEGKIRVIYTVH